MIKRVSIIFALLLLLSSGTAFSAGGGQKLFINLTSDNIDRAAMAMGFGTKMLKFEKMPVTLFLNVESVRIADRHIPGHRHASGKTLKEMLAGFIQAGGRVIICPMCMKNVGGMSKDDLVDGVEIGGPDVTGAALFAKDTTVMSY